MLMYVAASLFRFFISTFQKVDFIFLPTILDYPRNIMYRVISSTALSREMFLSATSWMAVLDFISLSTTTLFAVARERLLRVLSLLMI